MNSQFLFYLGLCIGQIDTMWDYKLLPKPILRARPSSVVPTRSNVTLKCMNFMRDMNCHIHKGDTNLDHRKQHRLRQEPPKLRSFWAVPGSYHFNLVELEESDAGYYTCDCYEPGDLDVLLQYSDAILLLVTGHLPKPSLQAHQWSKVPGGNVTLHCQKPDNMTEYKVFMLLKEGVPLLVQVQSSESNRAEFSLHDMTAMDTGNYSCVYHQIGAPFWASHPSDHLEILVSGPSDEQTDMEKDGYLPKPSLRVQHLGRVTTGEVVKLQCQRPQNSTEYQMFALLKEGISSPIQLLESENNTVEFTLQNVTVRDAGRYSCVYLQVQAPFRTSHPSDHLHISVAMSPSALSECYTKINLIRLEMSAVFVVLMAVFLAEAWYSQRVSCSRPRPCSTPGPL